MERPVPRHGRRRIRGRKPQQPPRPRRPRLCRGRHRHGTRRRQRQLRARRPRAADEQYGAVLGTDNPNLAPFRDRGGKIIIYHGLADQQIPAGGTIDYHKRVQQQMGGAEKTAHFARLFLVPGVDHGFRGAGPAPTGQFDAIVRWVEEGQPPKKLLAELRDKDGKIVRTRPLFPHPQIAKYKGSGSTDDAANFVSSPPAP